MVSQWEAYKAAREKAFYVPALSEADKTAEIEDKAFLDTPGLWARSSHPNLSQTMSTFSTTNPDFASGSSPKNRSASDSRVGFVGSLAMGMPLRDGTFERHIEDALARKASTMRGPTRSLSEATLKARGLPPFHALDPWAPGVPAKREYNMHSPCRDNNYLSTRKW
mmetsp:Transcript_52644/g.85330  ORF Transcript_52644/g.85330 Transcript_52644/m.85330 type:complete len:166 (-) Transcript_52644:53-550(-)